MPFYSDPENVTDLIGFTDYINSVTEQAFVPAMLLILFMIFYLRMASSGTEKSFAAASFFTSIFAVLFFVMGLVPEIIVGLLSMVTLVSTFLAYRSR